MEETKDNKEVRADSLSQKILQVTARMFEQHADLFEHQAAMLQTMSSRPDSPSSWAMEELPSESSQKQLIKEKTEDLIIKSYEGMLRIKRRVDYLQDQMKRNGITQVRHYLTADRKAKRLKKEKILYQTPFYWFQEDHGPNVAEEFGVESHLDYNVQLHLMKQWAVMSPEDRLPYEKKSQRELLGIDELGDPVQKRIGRPRKEAIHRTVGIESAFETELQQDTERKNTRKRSIASAAK
jgi:hypothetical protein